MNSLPWYHISLLSIAATLLFLFIIYHIVKFVKNSNSNCGVDIDPNKCNNSKCNKLLKKDFNHLLILFVVVLVFILVDLFIDDKNAMDYFSFASTIASIILSVVAIIFSITGDRRTEGLKRVLDEAIHELKDSTDTIKKYNVNANEQEQVFKEILNNSKAILASTEIIQEGVDTVNKNLKNSDKDMESSKPAYETKEVWL